MIEGVELHCTDALELMPSIPTASHDLVLCDPPYNVGMQYDVCDDKLSERSYLAWCAAWFYHAQRISSRFLVIFPGHKYLASWFHFAPSGVGCWHKPGSPSGGGSFRWCEWEPWLLWCKESAWCGYSDTITASLVSHGQKDTAGFPCPKPPKLYAELLKRFKPKSVLDPFMGSGTAGVESVKANIGFTGIEISPAYFALASERIALASGESPSQFTRSNLFAGVE